MNFHFFHDWMPFVGIDLNKNGYAIAKMKMCSKCGKIVIVESKQLGMS